MPNLLHQSNIRLWLSCLNFLMELLEESLDVEPESCPHTWWLVVDTSLDLGREPLQSTGPCEQSEPASDHPGPVKRLYAVIKSSQNLLSNLETSAPLLTSSAANGPLGDTTPALRCITRHWRERWQPLAEGTTWKVPSPLLSEKKVSRHPSLRSMQGVCYGGGLGRERTDRGHSQSPVFFPRGLG